MRKIYIYALADPETLKIRYIGKSTNPQRRYQAHVYRCNDNKYHSALWVKSILNKGLKPKLIVIEECEENNWQERERYWIAHYRATNDLTNILDGGEGCATFGRLGKTWTEQQRIRYRNARLGKPVTHTEKGDLNRAEAQRKYREKTKIPIYQYNLNGDFVKEWPSAVDAAISLNVLYSNLSRCAKNNNQSNRQAYGFMWHYYKKEKINPYVKTKPALLGKNLTKETKEKIKVSKKGVPWTASRRQAQNKKGKGD